MNEIFVLVMVTWLAGYVNGATITVQEFNSNQTCNEALNQITNRMRNWQVSGEKIQLLCVRK